MSKEHKEFDDQIMSGSHIDFDDKFLSAREVTQLALRNASSSTNSYIFTLSFFNDYFKGLSEEEQDIRVRYYIEKGFTYLIEMGIIANVIKVKEEYLSLTDNENIRLLLSYSDEYEKRRKIACEKGDELSTNVISIKSRLHYFKRFQPSMLMQNVKDFLKEEDFEVYIYNNDLGYSLESIIQPEIQFDMEWLSECDRYIQNLSIRDFFTLKGYTYRGDSIVNRYILSGLSDGHRKLSEEDLKYIEEKHWYIKSYFPLFFQLRECCKTIENKDDDIKVILGDDLEVSYKKVLECKFEISFYESVLEMYIEDLKRIINGAPSIKKESVVFRGSKTRYYSTNLGSSFKTVTFTSTSINSRVGTSNLFSSLEYTSCCMSKYRLNPGTKCILLETLGMKGECEVLLPLDTEFKVIDHSILSYLNSPYGEPGSDEPEDIDKHTLCNGKVKKVDFTEFISVVK